MTDTATRELVAPPARAPEDAKRVIRRGKIWVALSFIFCPCHLPVTLTLLTLLLGGTALGAVLRDNIVLAGIIITATWGIGTWRGMQLIRTANTCAIPKRRTLRQRVAVFMGLAQ
jgi:mercuric ion transport protein